ncbi:MMPL family transporter [Lysobacter sp. GX 14042]|uniref:MMPL family transporter n=1 Tax=Lysobacter sp. GX 14042 TaxID=2907155 RepID=UPI001F35394C|nr:MMPL family transporter [Lysobacter sp. GX 14042]MCE7032145.1 MMPL family transporter [Lysobacter sp. GX 14042]
MSRAARWTLVLAWLALLALAGAWLAGNLEVAGDLRRFMPEPRTAEQKLLLEGLGEGPGSRLLLIALEGAEPQQLAAQSAAIRQSLAADPRFALVANGEAATLDQIPEGLRPYRYLLAPTLDRQALDPDYLHEELQARLQDLGSPVGQWLEPLLPSDPTLQTLALAEQWQGAATPTRRHGVWFDPAGARALLLVQTMAPGFDPDGQAQAVEALREAFRQARGESGSDIVITGPGAFAVEVGGRTREEAARLGSMDTVAFVLLLLIAYRSWRAPLLGALPLASGGLAGLVAVVAGFEAVHGITLAFGFTLVGVAQDYPIHLFSNQRAGQSAWTSVRALWPALVVGVLSTCIAYLAFLAAGVEGLAQLAVFTITGLAVAALSTRYVLPALLDDGSGRGAFADPAESRRMQRLWSAVQSLPRLGGTAALVIAILAAGVVWWMPGHFWQNDLSRLTPVPEASLQADAVLRRELRAPDVRHLAVVRGADSEAALQASEHLLPVLEALRRDGVLAGYDLAARYLPSAATQRARQDRLPEPAALRGALEDAVDGTPFRGDVFEPFLADVETARTAAPLVPEALAGTPLAVPLEGLLLPYGDESIALVSLSGITDLHTLEAALASHGARLLDLKAASESLVAEYRTRLLWTLLGAFALLGLVVAVALRSPPRVLRVLAPMVLTTLVVLAVLRAAGVELNLFHLVALILAAGLGLDYALFFDHAGDSRANQVRALHAIIMCSLTTLLVFAVLASSSIPVLRAIGGTVALGVVGNFVLALLIARRPVAGREAAA